MDKAQYVKSAPNIDTTHTCHWPGCSVQVKPAMWGCQTHWFKLPKRLRSMIFSTFRPGQELDKNLSRDYVKAAQIVQNWIRENYGDRK